ncbi:DUF4132 domain-containing protein [Nonomuraea terrae]|uniref:DUF4132 domain-containing protein n=1 Tax=Nonomuraea terrae TaxID=2530383 RepID=UPI00379C8C47
MGVIENFPETYDSPVHKLDEAARALFAGFDAGLRPSGDPEERRIHGWWVQMRLGQVADRARRYDETLLATVRAVAGDDIPWTLKDVRFLWSVADSLMLWKQADHAELYRIPLAAVQRVGYPERRRVLHNRMWWFRTYHRPVWDALHEQLDAVLTEPPEHGPAGAVRTLIWEGDPVARAMADDHAERLTAPEVLPLLRHWTTARSSKPGERWLRTARALLTDEAAALVRELLAVVAAHREGPVTQVTDDGQEWSQTVFLAERTAIAARGMVWTCALIDEPWAVGLLGDLAVTCGVGLGGTGANCRSELLANAAVNALARRGGLDTVPALARVQAKVRKKSVLNNVARTLDAVALAAGLGREQLLDRTVPTFGLGRGGVREERAGDYVLRLDAAGPALTFVNPAGRTVKSVPQAIKREPVLAELRAGLKELRQALPAERFRLERALIEERRWRWHDVTEFFLDHPVTGLYARDLIWQIPQGPAGLPVRTETGWELTDPLGRRVQPHPDTPVLLWHPIRETAGDVRAWRDFLLERGVRQPYKQAFREVYLLTPAEESARTRSRRFTGHVLRYGQAKALLNQRGWTDLSIGHWDYECGGDQGEAIKELSGWRARWGMHIVGDPHTDGWGTASFCAAEDLRFSPVDAPGFRGWNAGEGVPLTEVPPLVLSEVLRDADLAVGVASVGLDQEVVHGHEDYWQAYGFGELSETARTRHDVLARLLPRLTIADRAELTDRFLRVRGELRTYKIHLGSGNILMEPNDAYLGIVPGHAPDVFLPFEEGGGMLSVILSKAFLLAADTGITDPSITRQLV